MNESDFVLVFDEKSKSRILNALGLKTNTNSELVDKEGKILINQDFEVIKEENFGGILRGSKVAITKSNSELVKYFVSKQNSK